MLKFYLLNILLKHWLISGKKESVAFNNCKPLSKNVFRVSSRILGFYGADEELHIAKSLLRHQGIPCVLQRRPQLVLVEKYVQRCLIVGLD